MRLLIGVLCAVGCGGTYPVDNDADGWFSSVDCDDSDPLLNPGQPEIPLDGVDNDCNPGTDDQDADGDGVLPPADCEPNNPNVPGSLEVPYDGLDNDCNPQTRDDDLDRDGFIRADDCDDDNAAVSPGATEVPYDDVDNDCNVSTRDDDVDGDGFGIDEDCDDNDPERVDTAVWYVDCDGDGYASLNAAQVETCFRPTSPTGCQLGSGDWTQRVPLGPSQGPTNTTTDCNDRNATVYPGQTDFFIYSGATLSVPYDFDCDGRQEPDFGSYDCFMLFTECQPQPGYIGIPTCGATLTFAETCSVSSNTCDASDGVTQVVACH